MIDVWLHVVIHTSADLSVKILKHFNHTKKYWKEAFIEFKIIILLNLSLVSLAWQPTAVLEQSHRMDNCWLIISDSLPDDIKCNSAKLR